MSYMYIVLIDDSQHFSIIYRDNISREYMKAKIEFIDKFRIIKLNRI